jgi:RNA polymerase sigma-70 factor (ECF subfamily)
MAGPPISNKSADNPGNRRSPADFVEFSQQNTRPSRSLQSERLSDGHQGHSVEGKNEAREKLVAACFVMLAQGRMEALGKLYDALARDLFGYVRSIVGSQADAEDVFQEAFTKLAQQREKLLRVERPLGYLFAIARNEAFRLLRKRARVDCVSWDGALFVPAPVGQTPRLTAEEIEGALAELTLDQRETVTLKVFEGFTFIEVGELMDVSPNTAASRYRSAMQKLAERLGRQWRNE